MINYGFVNLACRTSYISDSNFAYRGTWASGSTYNPPLDVVDYNNGKFIVLVANGDTPPLGSKSWSELVQIGTIAPSNFVDVASAALVTANAASVLSMAAFGTALQALSEADAALALAATGTALAQAAYDIATSGTVAGNNTVIANGTNLVFVSGLNLGYAPSSVVCTVQMPNLSGSNIWPTLVGAPSSDGFIARLSQATETAGYVLNWLIRK